ncbi:hypothetical protein [Flavobacterium humidisoli]|uniref:C1q domain-containing protein n=1 Tax=Flavobacterium humidisoli TaxID=2937442 RepID=A0ABY4LZJ9_9FLAO|nr:hypothetical protein [Flavobacterium humidisoli]UPZ17973.1 hypothetical protein M0M44_11640 [Flavobacterium humidisoli]
MKKTTLICFIMLSSFCYSKNSGIGTDNPNLSSKLEIVSSDKGILIPRVSLINSLDTTTISNGNVNSLLIFNTSSLSDVTPGFYFWYGSKWNKLITDSSLAVSSVTGSAPIDVANTTGNAIVSLKNLGVQNSHLADNAVSSAKILDSSIANNDLASGVGGFYKGSGSLSNSTVVTQGNNTLSFVSSAVNGFSVDGATLSIDAANNRVGIGTSNPYAALTVNGDVVIKDVKTTSEVLPNNQNLLLINSDTDRIEKVSSNKFLEVQSVPSLYLAAFDSKNQILPTNNTFNNIKFYGMIKGVLSNDSDYTFAESGNYQVLLSVDYENSNNKNNDFFLNTRLDVSKDNGLTWVTVSYDADDFVNHNVRFMSQRLFYLRNFNVGDKIRIQMNCNSSTTIKVVNSNFTVTKFP